MSLSVVVGLQWGDEGKAKVVDYLSREADLVCRFQGGANAGHTVKVGDVEHVFRIVPSCLLSPGVRGALGSNVVVDPDTLLSEIEGVERASGLLAGRLAVDYRCPVVLPYHKLEDVAGEERGLAVGTTRNGVGPCYRDKYERASVRVADVVTPGALGPALDRAVDANERTLRGRFGVEPPPRAEIERALLAFAERIKPFVSDVGEAVSDALARGDRVLAEGAQGTLLDVSFGTYPFVTSSNTVAGAVFSSLGIPPVSPDRVIGVVKAYTTRVGRGPFPTELTGKTGAYLAEAGGEVGSATGRPRRCGWLDLPLLRYAAKLNGATELVVTKLDVISGLSPLEVAYEYELDGRVSESPPVALLGLDRVVPRLRRVESFELGHPSSIGDLPAAARAYVGLIEEELGVAASHISLGRERSATLVC